MTVEDRMDALLQYAIKEGFFTSDLIFHLTGYVYRNTFKDVSVKAHAYGVFDYPLLLEVKDCGYLVYTELGVQKLT